MSVIRPLVLTTDFGLSDPYVGVMKGVILSINPRASIIDLTHQIQPQNIQQAAFLLGTNFKFFPRESIHLVVVDPEGLSGLLVRQAGKETKLHQFRLARLLCFQLLERLVQSQQIDLGSFDLRIHTA